MLLSAALALYRSGPTEPEIEVLIGRLGGPYFAERRDHCWSFPKGIVDDDETPLAGAEREFEEEMGSPAPNGETIDLGSLRSSGKTIQLFARRAEFDASEAQSNMFQLEWPPHSGNVQEFPEIERAAWVSLDEAERLLTKNQVAFVELLRSTLSLRESDAR